MHPKGVFPFQLGNRRLFLGIPVSVEQLVRTLDACQRQEIMHILLQLLIFLGGELAKFDSDTWDGPGRAQGKNNSMSVCLSVKDKILLWASVHI